MDRKVLLVFCMVSFAGCCFASITQPFYFDVPASDTFSVVELESTPGHITYTAESGRDHVVALIGEVASNHAGEFAALASTPGSTSRKRFTITPEHGVLVGEHDATIAIPYTVSFRKSGTSSYTHVDNEGTSFHWTPSSFQVGRENQVCVFAVAIEPSSFLGLGADTYSDYLHVEMAVE